MRQEQPYPEEHQRILKVLHRNYGTFYWWYVFKFILRKYVQKIRPFVFYPVKRLFDLLISGLLLIMLSPLFLVLIALVKRDGGPAFFGQIRIGRHGKEFKFWKFRSMVPNADKLKAALLQKNEMKGGVLFKIKDDPRITPIGRFLRRTSLDELPQLWNVFRGDMSLVGPRPALPEEINQYNSQELQRLEAQQGITCIWQVSGRSELPFNQQVNLDLEYIQNESLWNDIKLLLKTLPAVITGRGAS